MKKVTVKASLKLDKHFGNCGSRRSANKAFVAEKIKERQARIRAYRKNANEASNGCTILNQRAQAEAIAEANRPAPVNNPAFVKALRYYS